MGASISKPQNPQPPPDEELARQVFGNPLLRQKIFEHVLQIRKGLGESSYHQKLLPLSEARALRLVCRNWNWTTTDMFLKAKKPLLFFPVGYATTPDYCVKLMKFMEDFEAFYGSEENNWQPPPVSLFLALEVNLNKFQFRPKPIFSFWPFQTTQSNPLMGQGQDHLIFERHVAMLNNSGAPLVALTVRTPDKDLTEVPSVESLDLSLVQTILVYPFYGRLIPQPQFANFFQGIIDRCVNLQQYDTSVEDFDLGISPLHRLNPPNTLACLKTMYHPELSMAPNILDNLVILQLSYASAAEMGTANISRILTHCSHSLQQFHLIIYGGDFEDDDDMAPIFLDLASLPTLPNLRNLTLDTTFGESSLAFVPQAYMNVGHRFPSLESLVIYGLVGELGDFVNGWCSFNTPCGSLRELTLFFGRVQWTSNPSAMITKMGAVFPNVTSMTLEQFGYEDSNILSILFQRMPHLVYLSLGFCKIPEEASKDEWDAALIGTTVQMVEKLKKGRISFAQFLENAADPTLANGDEYGASIRSLKNLSTLYLFGRHSNYIPPKTGLLSSKLAFELGFLQAPQLQKLTLRGTFSATRDLIRRWSSGGRWIQTDVDMSRWW